ncbi:MAG: crossover junction endodeoxyribonuclease RuvC [Planctomycetes bacterium]|nr:crossover junction endodeoxyribonuclease RuvC [Planctomycetota bacterium]
MPDQSRTNRQPLRVLGIDPGTRIAGWACVERRGPRLHLVEAGVIRTKGDDPAARLACLHAGLLDVARRLGPHVAAIEEAFAGRNQRTALKIGEARGVALAAAGAAGLQVTGYAPRSIKQAVTGNGGADKDQVARMVALLLGRNVDGPSDCTDACAVAITHLNRGDRPA